MISLGNKRFDDPPKTLGNKPALDKMVEIINDAPNHDVNSIYNSDSVREKMRAYFGDKCIFCESIPIASSSFRIDHYRPKKNIKDVDPTLHYGYYWLSLEWTNLVQACELCNGLKSNKFPVNGSRVNALKKELHIIDVTYRHIEREPLKNEKRLLLHPELDKVEDHIIFLPNGTVKDNNSEIGKESIEAYGLNRDDLVLVRKKRVDNYFNDLVQICNRYEDRGADSIADEILMSDLYVFFKRLLKEQNEENEYSRLGFYMFHEFEIFFIHRLPAELVSHKAILKSFYTTLKMQRAKVSP